MDSYRMLFYNYCRIYASNRKNLIEKTPGVSLTKTSTSNTYNGCPGDNIIVFTAWQMAHL